MQIIEDNMVIKPPEENSPEAIKLDELRRKLVGFVPPIFRGPAAELLLEMDKIYFDWIDRLIAESREHLIESDEQVPEGEIMAVQDPDHSNVIHVNFGYQERIDEELGQILEDAGADFVEFEEDPEPPKSA